MLPKKMALKSWSIHGATVRLQESAVVAELPERPPREPVPVPEQVEREREHHEQVDGAHAEKRDGVDGRTGRREERSNPLDGQLFRIELEERGRIGDAVEEVLIDERPPLRVEHSFVDVVQKLVQRDAQGVGDERECGQGEREQRDGSRQARWADHPTDPVVERAGSVVDEYTEDERPDEGVDDVRQRDPEREPEAPPPEPEPG